MEPSKESSAICYSHISIWKWERGVFVAATYLEPSTANTRVSLRIRHLLHVRHDGALVGGVDDIAGPGGQGVAPREGRLGAGLDGDDGAGLGCGVGAAVADDVVGCYVRDGLG